jgi:hypothetical protein
MARVRTRSASRRRSKRRTYRKKRKTTRRSKRYSGRRYVKKDSRKYSRKQKQRGGAETVPAPAPAAPSDPEQQFSWPQRAHVLFFGKGPFITGSFITGKLELTDGHFLTFTEESSLDKRDGSSANRVLIVDIEGCTIRAPKNPRPRPRENAFRLDIHEKTKKIPKNAEDANCGLSELSKLLIDPADMGVKGAMIKAIRTAGNYRTIQGGAPLGELMGAIWDDSPTCGICQETLTWRGGRHHCRRCGARICEGCTRRPRSGLLLRFKKDGTRTYSHSNTAEPKPICTECEKVLSTHRSWVIPDLKFMYDTFAGSPPPDLALLCRNLHGIGLKKLHEIYSTYKEGVIRELRELQSVRGGRDCEEYPDDDIRNYTIMLPELPRAATARGANSRPVSETMGFRSYVRSINGYIESMATHCRKWYELTGQDFYAISPAKGGHAGWVAPIRTLASEAQAPYEKRPALNRVQQAFPWLGKHCDLYYTFIPSQFIQSGPWARAWTRILTWKDLFASTITEHDIEQMKGFVLDKSPMTNDEALPLLQEQDPEQDQDQEQDPQEPQEPAPAPEQGSVPDPTKVKEGLQNKFKFAMVAYITREGSDISGPFI